MPVAREVIRFALRAQGFFANPVVSGPLYALLAYDPSILHRIPLLGAGALQLLRNVAGAYFLLGVVSRINSALNGLAMNNWERAPRTPWLWDQEVAVVTGGSSGIGQAIARGLLRKGVKVAVLDIGDLPKEFEGNPSVQYVRCDVTSADEVAAAAVQVQQGLGHPSILINNAGRGDYASILSSPADVVRKTIEVNLMAHWFTVQSFLPAMVERNKGHVVTMSSIGSFVTLPGMVPYCATKAGLLAFHEGLTSEIRRFYNAPGIRTTIVHPTWVDTPLIQGEANAKVVRRSNGSGVILSAEQVADRVLENVFAGKAGRIILPESAGFLSTLKSWPIWMQEVLRDGSSGDKVKKTPVQEKAALPAQS